MKWIAIILNLLLILMSGSLPAQINDCSDAQVICDNANFGFNPIGPGYNDFQHPGNNPGCLTALEQNSAWYYFQIDPAAPAGLVLGFTIHPLGGIGEDYDWALFGPNVNCNQLGSPIRCSSSSAACGFCPETGMGMGAMDVTEGPGTGDGFVMTLAVEPGQGFYLVIDNWLGTTNGFIMEWTGTAAEYLNCDASPPCALEATAGNNISACEGDTDVQLNGGSIGNHGSEMYSWTSPNGGGPYLSNPNIAQPSVTIPMGFTGTITYHLTVTEDTCMSEDEVDIIVNPLPVVSIFQIGPFCPNQGPQGLSGMPVGGTWGGAATGNTFNPSINGPGLHTITYSYTNMNGCTGTTSIDIFVREGPEVSIDPAPAGFCENDISIQLTANAEGGLAGYTYHWGTTNGTGDLQTYTAITAGTHAVTVTDMNGCTDSTAVNVMVYLNPAIVINDPGPICGSLPFVTLSADPTGGMFDGDFISPQGDLIPNTIDPGTYTISYTVTGAHDCVSTEYLQIEIVAVPDAIASNNGPICSGQQIQLTGATTSTGSVITYLWTGPNGYTSSQQNPMDATTAGVYSLQVIVDDCASVPVMTTVTLHDAPDASAANGGPYCNGEAIQLNGSTTSTGNNITYLWTGPNGYSSNLQNPSDATGAGTYSLIVNVDGCPSLAVTTEVIFSTAPDASASNSGPYCEGEAIALFGSTMAAGSSITYQWTGPNGYASSMQNPTDAVTAGVYSLIVVVDGCLSNTESITVVVNPSPQPVITGQHEFCTGFSSVLDAGAGYLNYQWDDTSMGRTREVFASGTYTVTVTDMNGCTGAAQFDVIENASLSPVITGTLSFCAGDETVLDAGSGYAFYDWSTNGTGQTIQVSSAGNIAVTVTDASGCTGVASVTTIVHPNPTPTIGGSTTYCTGGSSILDAGAYTSYVWSNDSVTQTITVATPGVYGVTVTDGNGCSGATSVNVQESTSLNPVITGNTAFCENSSTTLNAGSGFATYLWSDSSANQTLVVSVAGSYSVTVSDGQGCSGETIIEITEEQPPIVELQDGMLCNGLASGSSLNLFDLILSGGLTGSWQDISSSGATGLFSNLNFTAVAPGAYPFSYTVPSQGVCPDVVSETIVEISPTPVVTIADDVQIDCANLIQTLDAGGSSSGPEFEIIWAGPGVITDGNEHTLMPNVDAAGTYVLLIRHLASGCQRTDTITVTASTDPPSGAVVIGHHLSCDGDQDGSIEVQQVFGGTPPYLVSVNGGPFTGSSEFDHLTEGEYSITIEDANGCQWDTAVFLLKPQAISVDIGDDIEVGIGEGATVHATVSLPLSAIDTLIWSPAVIISCLDANCLDADVFPVASTTLTATIYDTSGCQSSDQIELVVDRSRHVFIPSVFSPNGDGVNDVFFIAGDVHQILQVKQFWVFDRWGGIVYTASGIAPNDPVNGWNGMVRGKIVDPGVFAYRAEIEFVDHVTQVYLGDVTVLR